MGAIVRAAACVPGPSARAFVWRLHYGGQRADVQRADSWQAIVGHASAFLDGDGGDQQSDDGIEPACADEIGRAEHLSRQPFAEAESAVLEVGAGGVDRGHFNDGSRELLRARLEARHGNADEALDRHAG